MRKAFFVLSGMFAVGLLTHGAYAASLGSVTANLNSVGTSFSSGNNAIGLTVTNSSLGINEATDAGELQWTQTNAQTAGAFNIVSNNGGSTATNSSQVTQFYTYCIDIVGNVPLPSTGNTFDVVDLSNSTETKAVTAAPAVEALWGTFNMNSLINIAGINAAITQAGGTDLGGTDTVDAEAVLQVAIWKAIFGGTLGTTVSNSAINTDANDLLSFITNGTNIGNGLVHSVDLLALDSTNGGQNQGIFQAGVGTPPGTPLPKSSLAGILLLGGFGAFSLRRKMSIAR
jgi:hypothetical protein